MAEVQQTNPVAAQREAEELRVQASALLARAESLDPTPAPKKRSPRKKPVAKKASVKKDSKVKKAVKKVAGKGKK